MNDHLIVKPCAYILYVCIARSNSVAYILFAIKKLIWQTME